MKRRTRLTILWLAVLLVALGLSTAPKIVQAQTSRDLYVSSFANNKVVRYNGTTGALIGDFTSGGGLDQATGLVFGPDGNLYVSNGGGNQVIRYNGTTGALIGVFASGGGLGIPAYLVFAPAPVAAPTPVPPATPKEVPKADTLLLLGGGIGGLGVWLRWQWSRRGQRTKTN